MEAFEASKTAPNDILPLARTHLLAIPKQSHQRWTTYSKLEIMKRNSFKPESQVTHSTCKFKTRKSFSYFVVWHAKINPLLSRLKCDKNFPTSSTSTVGALHQTTVIIWEVCYHPLTGCMGYIPVPATHFTSATVTLGKYKSDCAIAISKAFQIILISLSENANKAFPRSTYKGQRALQLFIFTNSLLDHFPSIFSLMNLTSIKVRIVSPPTQLSISLVTTFLKHKRICLAYLSLYS